MPSNPSLPAALAVGLALALGGCGQERAESQDTAAQTTLTRTRTDGSAIIPPYGAQGAGGGATTAPAGAPAGEAATPAAAAPAEAEPAAASEAPAAGGATLPDGEYACYGSGMQVLAGLGFKVRGGRYTDLDGGNAGTVSIDGSRVVFTGGHMSEIGGGRDYNGKSFRVGSMASCEKW